MSATRAALVSDCIESLSGEAVGKRYRNAIVDLIPRRRPGRLMQNPSWPHSSVAGWDSSVRRIAAGIVCGFVIAWPVASSAGLYKCARDDGTVMYQEDPCPSGKELRDFERDPATVSVIPFRAVPGSDVRAAERPSPPASRSERSKPRKTAERQGNPAERKFLVPGIGEGEVVARIGRPDMSSGAGRKTVRWTYLPAAEDPQTITTLTFELGRLTQVERKVVRTP